jgi:hypothetical protein
MIYEIQQAMIVYRWELQSLMECDIGRIIASVENDEIRSVASVENDEIRSLSEIRER